ncbi:MAG: DNA sulfur modification protein DndB [Gammaproteobacteria bacterium]
MFTKLDVTQGHLMAGVEVSPNLFLGRMTTAQLFQVAPNPMLSEDRRNLESSKVMQDLYETRKEMQRLFAGAKKANVPSYARYIVEVKKGGAGITPPIILFSEGRLETETVQYGLAAILIPFDRSLVAIDGETQLAARYEAAEADPATKGEYVPVMIAHGRSQPWARQAFHDLNVLGVRPNAALSIGMDARDPLTQVARDVEESVPLFRGRVNKVRRQLRSSDTDITTITSLRGACVTFSEGIAGVKYGAKPVPVPSKDVERVKSVAIEWFNLVAQALGPAIEDRVHKLASAPAVLAAIGAMGNELLSIDSPQARSQRATQLINKLKTVDWRRTDRWAGLAGKVNAKGELSIGGSKETAYAVFGALADETSPAYAQVRALSSAVSTQAA